MNKHMRQPHPTDYDTDYFLWSERQAALVRKLRIEGLDAENVAEEIESLGRSDKRELSSRCKVLMQLLLKWQFQKDQRSNSWRASINEARDRINDILADSPSLKLFFRTNISTNYSIARKFAADETGINESDFPVDCAFSEMQLLDFNYLPD